MYDEPQPPEPDSNIVLSITMFILWIAVVCFAAVFWFILLDVPVLIPLLYCAAAIGFAVAVCWAVDGYDEAKKRLHYWYIIKRNDRNVK